MVGYEGRDDDRNVRMHDVWSLCNCARNASSWPLPQNSLFTPRLGDWASLSAYRLGVILCLRRVRETTVSLTETRHTTDKYKFHLNLT